MKLQKLDTGRIDQKGLDSDLDSDLGYGKACYLCHLKLRSYKHRHKQRASIGKMINLAKRLRLVWSENPLSMPPDIESPKTYPKRFISLLEEELKPRHQQKTDLQLGKRVADSIGIGRLSAQPPDWGNSMGTPNSDKEAA